MPQAEELLRRQKALGDFGDFVLDHDDLQAVLDEGCRLVAQALGTDLAKVLQIEEGGATAMVRAGVGWRPDIVGVERLNLRERSSEAFAIETGAPVITQDLACETRFHFPSFLMDHAVVALVSVPIFLPGRKPWGVLQVDAREPRLFEQEDIEFLRTYSMVLGPVVDRLEKLRGQQESEAKYRTLFESIDEGFCIIEVLGRQQGSAPDYRLVEVNQAFERQTGLSNIVGKLGSEVEGGTEDRWADTYEEVLRTGEPARVDGHHAGTDRWYDIYMSRVGGAGSRLICKVFQDTTERRKRQERQNVLLALGDAARANRSAQAIMEAAARLLGERLKPSRVVFTEFDEEQGIAEVSQAWLAEGSAPIPKVAWLRECAGPLLDDLRAGRTIRIDDATQALPGRPDLVALAEAGIGAALSVPLIVERRLLATLSLHQHEPRCWADGEVALLQDVAERLWADVARARAEEALRRSEERLKRVLETPAVGVLFFDGEGRLVEANQAFLEMSGYSREQIQRGALSWQNMTPADWHEVSRDEMDKLRLTGQLGPYEKEYLLADGSRRWLMFAARDLGDGTIVEFCFDVTDKKVAEEALRRSEQRLAAIFRTAPVGISLVSRDGRFKQVNQALTSLLGRSERELLEDSITGVTIPEDIPPSVEAVRGAIEANETRSLDKAYHRPDGARVHANSIVTPLPPHGDQGDLLVVTIDLTQRRAAEQALRRSEERFRQFGEASSDLLWIRNATDLRFEYLSPSFERLYGIPRSKILDENHVRSWLRRIHPSDRKGAVASLRRLRQGIPLKHEFRIRSSNGASRWIQNTDFPMLDESGELSWIAGIAEDITERKRAVDLQATLLAELQHRVRNILAMIRSLIRRTSLSKHDVADFVDHLQARLDALARTQSMLTRTPGQVVDLETMVREELLAQAACEEQIQVKGSKVALSAKSAEVLTLAVHELATNSVKYGVLGSRSGHLFLHWSHEQRNGERWLLFRWRETGGEEMAADPSPGFGTELITRRVPYELGGTGEMSFGAEGLEVRIEFPLRDRGSPLQTDAGRLLEAAS